MPATDRAIAQPAVSVIVPARNEEACLDACLQSLVDQSFADQTPVDQGIVDFEIIVVDDHSTDRTHEIANSFAGQGVRVVDAGPLPAGWTGKNNAVTAGAKAARGQWLLFTDADTIHLPGSLARGMKEVKLWEKAVMPVIFAELAASFRPSQVSDPKSVAAAANGQYILISREAYDAVGGHAAVATNLLEDVALARAVKQSGRKIFFRYGGDAVRTRMYRSFAQLREGWTKNLALLFLSPLRLAALRATEFVLIVTSFAVAIDSRLRGRWRPTVITAVLCVAVYGLFLRRVRRAHFPAEANVLALFGLPLFSYLLLRSERSHRRGTVCWKGREYPGNPLTLESLTETDPATQEKHGLSHAQS